MEPKFDKDIELLKITLLSEEVRASHFTIVGLWISLYVTILAGIYSLLGVTDRIEVTAFLVAFLFGILYIYRQIRVNRSEYDSRLAKLNSLIKTVESGGSVGDLDELRKRMRKTKSE